MIEYEERKINLPGFQIAAKIWHPHNSRPVLCLHGKLDNAASFDLLAPLLSQLQLVAIDYPGAGYSSAYQAGALPAWKSDAFLMLHLIDALKWKKFDIIAHSLGSLLATYLAIARPQQVGKLIFLDVLGPTVNFIEQRQSYLLKEMEIYLNYTEYQRAIFSSQETAILDRMKNGNISYQAARALVKRGTIKTDAGWMWNFDQRLRCIVSNAPYEDELAAMLSMLESPVCLIRATSGIPYPADIFQRRIQAVKNLIIHEVAGGHHVHMDEPNLVAAIIAKFLNV